MKNLKGTEKQIKWAEDIINKGIELAKANGLDRVEKELNSFDDAAKVIEEYKYITSKYYDAEKILSIAQRREREIKSDERIQAEMDRIDREMAEKNGTVEMKYEFTSDEANTEENERKFLDENRELLFAGKSLIRNGIRFCLSQRNNKRVIRMEYDAEKEMWNRVFWDYE